MNIITIISICLLQMVEKSVPRNLTELDVVDAEYEKIEI